MEMLINVQSNKIATVVRATEKGKVLSIDGTEKEYAASTLKRWWKSYVAPVVEIITNTVTPETVEPATSNELPEGTTDIAKILVRNATRWGCTINVTKSYIGIKVGKKTIMEIHCSKKGKTKVVVNSKSLDATDVDNFITNSYAKQAPASYGWTLDLTVQADEVTTSTVLMLLDRGHSYRR